jgi:hypothetical protein
LRCLFGLVALTAACGDGEGDVEVTSLRSEHLAGVLDRALMRYRFSEFDRPEGNVDNGST